MKQVHLQRASIGKPGPGARLNAAVMVLCVLCAGIATAQAAPIEIPWDADKGSYYLDLRYTDEATPQWTTSDDYIYIYGSYRNDGAQGSEERGTWEFSLAGGGEITEITVSADIYARGHSSTYGSQYAYFGTEGFAENDLDLENAQLLGETTGYTEETRTFWEQTYTGLSTESVYVQSKIIAGGNYSWQKYYGVIITAVPEPASLGILGLGGLALLRRRFR